jgi:hypothetical protein
MNAVARLSGLPRGSGSTFCGGRAAEGPPEAPLAAAAVSVGPLPPPPLAPPPPPLERPAAAPAREVPAAPAPAAGRNAAGVTGAGEGEGAPTLLTSVPEGH